MINGSCYFVDCLWDDGASSAWGNPFFGFNQKIKDYSYGPEAGHLSYNRDQANAPQYHSWYQNGFMDELSSTVSEMVSAQLDLGITDFEIMPDYNLLEIPDFAVTSADGNTRITRRADIAGCLLADYVQNTVLTEYPDLRCYCNADGLLAIHSPSDADEYAYIIDGNQCIITSYLGCETHLSIPIMIEGKQVTTIDKGAFAENETIEQVVLPEGLLYIDEQAFLHCKNLSNIVIPSTVIFIGPNAFAQSGLTSCVLPEGLQNLGNSAFNSCKLLQSITLPSSLDVMGSSVLAGCASLRSVTIPDGITTIDRCFFDDCYHLEEIYLPDTLTCIKEFAFYRCTSLRTIALPAGINTIEQCAFQDCINLIEIAIPNGVTKISNAAFSGCESLQTIVIPDTVTEIETYAFYDCYSLTNIAIPDSVTAIGNLAFQSCKSLSTITIPFGVTTIGLNMFSQCSNLASITIPDSVTSIENNAFNGCSSLTSITIPDGLTNIGTNVFSSCGAARYANLDSEGAKTLSKANYTFRVPGSNAELKYIYANDEISDLSLITVKKDIESCVIPEGVTSIQYQAFLGCSNLASVTIPDSVTSIGSNAFNGCGSLMSITIPDNMTSIAATAFSSCDAARYANLDSKGAKALSKAGYTFHLPGSIPELRYIYTNDEITDLSLITVEKDIESCEIPDGVTSIAYYAFYNCSNLASITIPVGVTSIEYNAFSYCSNLTSITIPEGVTSIGNEAFSYCNSLKSITIPDGVLSIGNNAFYSCSSLTSIAIPAGVTSIGSGAFPKYAETLQVECNSYALTWARENSYCDFSANPTASGFGYIVNHQDIVVDASIAATCEEAGLTEGSHCTVCNETVVQQEVIAALGHDWGEPTYTWSDDNTTVTATRVCGNDAEHIETETVNVTSEVTTAATCLTKGKTT